MSRDFVTEMRQVIDAETADGAYSAPILARHIVYKLLATDPELLEGWLLIQATAVLSDWISTRDRSRRSHVRKTSRRDKFAQDAKAFQNGNETAITGWLEVSQVMKDGSRRRISELTGEELLWVAGEYARQAVNLKLHEAFLRAIAKKVGKDKVSDHFTNQQLDDMWRSLGGGP